MSKILGLGDIELKDPLGLYKDQPGLGGGATRQPETQAAQPTQRSSTPVEGISEKDWNDLVDTVIAEAGGEGDQGMAAVTHVIRNRANAAGGDVGAVIRQPRQFEGYENPRSGSRRSQQDPAVRARAEQIVRGVLAGETPDPTGGADHFHADYVSPSWAGEMPRTAQIGGHTFYQAGTFPGAGRGRQQQEARQEARGAGGDPEGRGMARLMPAQPESEPQGQGAGGTITFRNRGQDRLQPPLMSALENASRQIGRDLTITSGFRSPSHPVEARKQQPGQHARGTAADIDLKGMSETERAQLVAQLQAQGVTRFGLYSGTPDMLHVDLKDQTGSGDPWFMYDRTNRNMAKAPDWFRDLSEGRGPRVTAPAGQRGRIVMDDSFKAADPMGLYGDGSSPFQRQQTQAAPAPGEEAATGPDPMAEQFQLLDADDPGRYQLIPADQYEDWYQRWQEAQKPDPLTATGWVQSGVQAIIEGAGGSAAGSLQGIGILLRMGGAESVGALFEAAGSGLQDASQSVGPDDAYRGVVTDILSGLGSMGIYLTAGWASAAGLGARGVGAVGQGIGGMGVAVSLAGPAGSAEAYNRAIEYGLSDEEALEKAIPGFGAGAVQVAPVGLILRAIPPNLRGNAIAQARHILEAAGGEFIAEGFGAVIQNLIEQSYNPEKGTWDDTLYQAAIGGSAGALTQLGVLALTRGRGGPVGRPQQGGEGGGMEVQHGPLTEALEHGEEQAVRQAERQQVYTVDDPAIGDMEAGPFHGQQVTATEDQTGVPEGMRRVIRPDGNEAVVGERILQGAEQAPQRPARQRAAPAVPEGAPPVGARVRVQAEGVEPFPASIEGYEDGEAMVLDMSSGEIMQVPLDAIVPEAVETAAPPASVEGPAAIEQAGAGEAATGVTEPVTPDRPIPTEMTRGMRAQLGDLGWSEDAIEAMSPAEADSILRENRNPETAPVDPNDPALEPAPPQAADQSTELPPRSEQRPAAEVFPGPPPAGSRVIVDAPGIDRFPGRVERYEGDEAVVVDDAGTPMQIPLDHLYVSKLTRAEIEAQEQQRNPPVERERPTGPQIRDVRIGKAQTRPMQMPDDRHARLFDLGAARRQAQQLGGTSALDRDATMPAEQRRLAEEFGVDPQSVGQIADDYRYRVERAARSSRSDLPQKMRPVNPDVLKRFKGAQPLAEAVEDATETTPNIPENIPDAAPDAAIHEAATSPQNALPEPSQAQKEAGNYRKGHVRHGGLDLSIENPEGSTRRGTSRSGRTWSTTMKSHYGYIKGTTGKDKDHIDVFLNPKKTTTPTDADPVFVVDQTVPAKKAFDEHKVMLGYGTADEARAAYLENYAKGWKGMGDVTPTTLGAFKAWLETGDTTKPFAAAQGAQNVQNVQQSDADPGLAVIDAAIADANEVERVRTLWAADPDRRALARQFLEPMNAVELGAYPHAGKRNAAALARDYLASMGKKSGSEYMVMFGPDGSVLAHHKGGPASTGTTPAMMRALVTPGADAVAHHNHPSSTSLSRNDVSFLAHPGLAAVWAHGHDGTSSRASLTDAARQKFAGATDPADPVLKLMKSLDNGALFQALQARVTAGDITVTEATAVEAVLRNIAWHRAGVFDFVTNIPAHPIMDDAAIQTAAEESARATARAIFGEDAALRGYDRPAVPVRHPGDVGITSLQSTPDAGGRPDTEAADRRGREDDRRETRQVEAKKASPRKSKPTRKQQLDRFENFFRPGRILRGYSGQDRVIAFERLPGDTRDWQVRVEKVDDAGNAIDQPRTHATAPDERDLVRWERENPVPSKQAAPSKPAPAVETADTKEAVQAKLDQWGAENKLVTRERATELRRRLKDKLNQLSAGIDPEILAIGTELAAFHIEAGARRFTAFARAVAEDLDQSLETLRPYLRAWYNGARDMMEDSGLSIDGMDDADAVRAELARLDKPEEAADGRIQELDQDGQEPLAGAPAEEVRGAPEGGQAGRGPAGGSQSDLFGGEPARGERVSARRGVPDGEGAVSAAPAGERGRAADRAQPDAASPRGSEQRAAEPASLDLSQTAITPAQERPTGYAISDADQIGTGGAKTKFKNNVAAIRLVKELEAEGRTATRSEQATLAKWVGWGGLSQVFEKPDGSVGKGWDKEAADLKELLTEEEYAAARRSTQDAHYTSPEVVKAIWNIADRLGFRGGQVLEPSVGAGNFLGLMPSDRRAGSRITAVELDSITGGIAKHLYPGANVIAPKGFQDVALPDGYFDLAIGNPPFGRTAIYDGTRRHLNKLSIHNYFFAKSLDTLRPGGVLAMVVSNYFMDSTKGRAKDYVASKADLIGAIRLPNTAFMANAGTEVTTDIVILRKRAEEDGPGDTKWTDVGTFKDREGREVNLSRYFIDNPDMMLGEFGAFGTMYRGESAALVEREGQNTNALLEAAIDKLPRDIMPAPGTVREETISVPREAADALVGSYFMDATGKLYERTPDSIGRPQASEAEFASDKARERVAGMVRIRDTFARLRRAQIDEKATDKQIEQLRGDLNKFYDAFVKANGPINLDANKRVFRDDPTWPQVSALENDFDKGLSAAVAKKTGEAPRAPSAKKAPIFAERTQQPYRRPTEAKSAKDALAQVLADFGRVDMAAMSRLYGKSETAIADELGALVYRAPDGQWQTADAYLSGNVRQKLAEAQRAAENDPAFRRNVVALEEVQPADIEAVDIDAKAGSPWVPANHVADFVDHITNGRLSKAVYVRALGRWDIDAARGDDAAATQWATDRVTVAAIVEAAINDRAVTVTDPGPNNTRVVNQTATEAANEKVERVKQEWRTWLWQDEARRAELSRLYNDTFNTDLLRPFDGSHLTLPGKVGDEVISLRPHQKAFVWRAMQSSTVLADHVVGAGKTFAAIAAVMEKRRIGQWRKPVVVVPNHLVGQWAADFLKLYPGARILAASKKDFEAGNRKRFFVRMATGEWDAIIVAHSSFGRIGVDPATEEAFINEQVAHLDESITALRQSEGTKDRSIKQIEAQKDRLTQRLKSLYDQANKDEGMTFDEIGIDGIVVDEAHEFKNLGFATGMTRIAGLGNPIGSKKAADLHMKLRVIKQRTGGNTMFLTGTPISNTMAEMYTVQRYLDEDGLKALGVEHFDAWAKVFGEVVNDWELSPAGKYKLTSRFSRFVNIPELMQRYRSFADVISNDDIRRQLAEQGKTLPIPAVKGGKPQNIVVPRSNEQAFYIGTANEAGDYRPGSLVHRAENLPKGKLEKGADNMLKVMSDARKAALDMRLIDPSYPDNPGSKIHVAADRMVELWRRWSGQRGTQLVFIDLSTPKASRSKEADRIRDLIKKAEAGDERAQETLDAMSPDEFMALDGEFSVYDDLKAKLIDRGVPAEEIAFIHDANTDLQKEELFGKVRSGRVRFLFGSTAKMGAGTNVQNRLVGLHHLDAPWRPSDLEQREGRIIRQGNELYAADPDGFAVDINRYATEMTLDSRMWQTIEGKARFIGQVRAGSTGDRVIEDIGGEAANAAEMKAAASGNPLILEEMDLRQKLRKLDNQSREHDREQHRIADRLRSLANERENIGERMPKLRTDSDAAFAAINEGKVEIGEGTFEKPGDYGSAIVSAGIKMLQANTDIQSIGKFGAFKLRLENTHDRAFRLHVDGALEHTINLTPDIRDADNVGVGMKLRNTVKGLVDMPADSEARLEQIGPLVERLEGQQGPFAQADTLAETRLQHQKVLDQLKPKQNQAAPGEATAAPDGAEASIEAEGRLSPDPAESRPPLSIEDQTAIAEIVRDVAGLDEMTFARRIVLQRGAAGWGTNAPVTAEGFYDPAADAIVLSMEDGSTRAAYHEAFHRLQRLFLKPSERAVLKAEVGRLRRIVRADPGRRDQVAGMSAKELEAEAFAIYATGDSTASLHRTIRAAWDAMADMVRRVRNYVAGRGFQTAGDVFARAKTGETAGRARQTAATPAQIEASLPRASEIVRDLKGKATDWTPALLGGVPLNYFNELRRPNMTAVDSYLKVKRAMDAYRGRKHAQMDEISQDWRKYTRLGWGPLGRKGKSRAAELASLMHDTTIAGIDPTSTDPDIQADPRFPALRKRFLAMPRAGQELYAKVRDAYVAQADETDRILLANIKKAQEIAREKAKEKFDADIARIRRHTKMSDSAKKMAIEDATREYTAARTKADWSMKARLTRMRVAFESSRVPPPYFPLARFGDYSVVVKDVDGEVLSFSKRETVADRDRLAEEMRKAFPGADVTVGKMDVGASARDTMDPRLVAEIEGIVGGAGLDPTTTATMLDQIWQRYLETMPDLSVRKRFIHRKGLPGFESDALRTFAHHMFHASHQMGRLKYGLDLQEHVNRSVEQAKKSDDPTRGTTLTNELRKRHEWVMNPTSAKWSTTINAISFTWMLGATPAAAMINMTQTAMLGIPILGARLGGMGKASAALAKAAADSVVGTGTVTRANLTADEKKAMEAFYESGLIDRSQAHDLAGVGETGVAYSPVRAKVMRVIAFMYHHAEVWNREVTALAAYRLAKAEGQDDARAIDTAHDLTWKTHFDYSNASRARYLQGDVGKALFVFQSHTLNMTYRILRDTHQALKGDTPAARREARYQLAGILGMMSFLAGGTGVFGYTTMMALLQMFFGDDDDPMDFEQHVKKAVLETLGPTAGGIVLKGVPGHLLGIELTQRIGMPYLWLRPESREMEGRAEFESFVMRALGANVGMIGNWWHGASIALNDGKTGRGVEMAAPKFVKDYMKAFRYLNEGLTNLRGDEILAPGSIDPWDGIAQAIGFTPARISETYERNSALRNAERRVMDRRRQLVNQYALAHRLRDREARTDAIDAIKRFNAVPINRPMAITPETLQRSLAARDRNTRRREDGVLIQNERLGRDLRRMLPEIVYR